MPFVVLGEFFLSWVGRTKKNMRVFFCGAGSICLLFCFPALWNYYSFLGSGKALPLLQPQAQFVASDHIESHQAAIFTACHPRRLCALISGAVAAARCKKCAKTGCDKRWLWWRLCHSTWKDNGSVASQSLETATLGDGA